MPEALTAFCATHSTAPAVVTCKRCGSFLCDACVTLEGDESYCSACTALRNRPASLVARGAFSLSILTIAVFVLGFGGPFLFLPVPFIWLTAVVLNFVGRRQLRAGDESENTRRLLFFTAWISVAGALPAVPILLLLLLSLAKAVFDLTR